MKKIFTAIATMLLALTLVACDPSTEEGFVDITLQSDVTEAQLSQNPSNVTEGMDVTVTASEVDGYAFSAWVNTENGTELSTERTYTFNVEEPLTLEAVYEEAQNEEPSLSLSSNVSGESWTVSDQGPYENGDEVLVEADEKDTFTFVHWIDKASETVVSEERSFTYTIDGDTTLEAVYEDTLEPSERTAQTVVDEATSDTAYLDTLMSDFNTDEGMAMSMHMAFEQKDPDTSETVVYDMQVDLSTTTSDESTLTKLNMSMETPDMPQSPLNMTVFMEENAQSTTITMDAQMLLDMIQDQEEGIDLRTLLDLNSDYIHYTIPHDLEGTDQEVILDQLMDELYIELYGPDYNEEDLPDLDQASLNTLFENMRDMMTFMSFAHLSEYDDVELTMDREGAIAKGTLSMGGDALEAFARDLFEEVYTTLELLDENDELTPYSDYITSQEYTMAMGIIGVIPDINIFLDYDAENEIMNIDVDVYTLLNFFMEGTSGFENVSDITMEMAMDKGVTIDDSITESESLESIVEEFVQIMTVVDSKAYFGAVASDGEIPLGTHTLEELESMGHAFDIPYIDKTKSTLELVEEDSTSSPTYLIRLYYTHSGEPVFVNTPISLSAIDTVLENEPTTREDVLDILALVDDEHFELYSVMGSMIDQLMEEAVVEEPDVPLPESDLVTASEPDFFTRYTGSILTDFNTPDDTTDLYFYAVDATPEDVKTFYSDYYTSADEWSVAQEEQTSDGYTLNYYSETVGYSLQINISNTSDYDSGIQYSVYVIDMYTV